MNNKDYLKMIGYSIDKIAYICEECKDHESSWTEFSERVKQILAHETKVIKMLTGIKND